MYELIMCLPTWTVSGEAGPEAGVAGVSGVMLLELGDTCPGDCDVSGDVCVSGDMGGSAILRDGGESGPVGDNQDGLG